MENLWTLKPIPDAKVVSSLQESLGVAPIIATLLAQRGINTFEEAKQFFRPQLSDLNDPFLMKDMDKAVERLSTAISNNEKILVYGDYDVDGTTAVSLMYLFLKGFSKNVEHYIPDRYGEGYGVSYKGIDYAKDNDFKDIKIAVDFGLEEKSKEFKDLGNEIYIKK